MLTRRGRAEGVVPTDSPLWEAIKLLKRARRCKACPAMVRHLEERVREEAAKVAGHITEPAKEWVRRVVEEFGEDSRRSGNMLEF